jgi:hypothetical protein
MKRSIHIALCTTAMTLLFAVTAQALTADGVMTGRSNVWYPTYGVDPNTGDSILSFTQVTGTGHANAWFRRNSDPKTQLNTRAQGWDWGLDAAATTIAYQTNPNGNSDIKLYNWTTGKRSDAGSLVNTPRWEYQPSNSANWLLFARLNTSASPDVRSVYLVDTATQTAKRLDRFRGGPKAGNVWIGQVNGDWAAWEKDTNHYRNDTVYRYQVSTGQTEQIDHPSDRWDYASSITPDGTMYFVRTSGTCGKGVRLKSLDASDTLVTVYQLPAGYDVVKTFAVVNGDGSTSIYFDSYRCAARRSNGNLYQVTIPAGGGAAVVTGGPVGTADAVSGPGRSWRHSASTGR